MMNWSFVIIAYFGKFHRLKFKTGKHISGRPLKYAHVNLWSRTRAQTHGRSYFLTIIDDYSRRV